MILPLSSSQLMSFMRVGDKVRISLPTSVRLESLVILEETRSDFPPLAERLDTGGSIKKRRIQHNNHRKLNFQREKSAKKTEDYKKVKRIFGKLK